ncbi:MAG: hypothetical protein JW778_06645 [Candidatus Altiarchaeota archaeon]|nr:hypothetical protein [Candidatus Altiarchaeota archaeon]
MIRIGLEKLEAEIKKNIASEIEKIEAETQKEIESIRAGFQKSAGEQAEKIRRDSEKEKEMIQKRIVADAKTQVKEMICAEKNRIIDEVFQEAGSVILNLNEKEKKRTLEALAEEGRKEVKDPVILVDGEYKKLLKGAEAAELGDFGVVIVNKEGTLRIDSTLGSRLKQMKKTLKPRIASILFAENDETLSDR